MHSAAATTAACPLPDAAAPVRVHPPLFGPWSHVHIRVEPAPTTPTTPTPTPTQMQMLQTRAAHRRRRHRRNQRSHGCPQSHADGARRLPHRHARGHVTAHAHDHARDRDRRGDLRPRVWTWTSPWRPAGACTRPVASLRIGRRRIVSGSQIAWSRSVPAPSRKCSEAGEDLRTHQACKDANTSIHTAKTAQTRTSPGLSVVVHV